VRFGGHPHWFYGLTRKAQVDLMAWDLAVTSPANQPRGRRPMSMDEMARLPQVKATPEALAFWKGAS
jgi:hypothetical protein